MISKDFSPRAIGTAVGAMGKVTQLVVGAALPGNVTANLMTANVSGGSASQCADLMNDLKTGHLLGSSPRAQWISQLSGVLAGSLVGSAIYLALIPDPKSQLFTPEWAAPAVITSAWYERFWVVVCAGIIAGESLVGVGVSLKQMLGG